MPLADVDDTDVFFPRNDAEITACVVSLPPNTIATLPPTTIFVDFHDGKVVVAVMSL